MEIFMILFTALCIVLCGIITFLMRIHASFIKVHNTLDLREWLLFFSLETPHEANFVSRCMASEKKVSYITTRFLFNFSLEKLLKNEWIKMHEKSEENHFDNSDGVTEKYFVLTDLGKKIIDAYMFQKSILPLMLKTKMSR